MEQDNLMGITQKEALRRLRKYGYNELPSQKQQSVFTLFINLLKQPMLILLLLCGLIYIALGDLKDASLLFVTIIVVIGITFYQERKSEKALSALKNLASPRALVIRDGGQVRIPGREVVLGDIIILQEGDRVAADARILSQTNLLIDESLLTGESLAVGKRGKSPLVYLGTLIVQGRGIAEVTAVGEKTEMGKIGKSIETIEEEDTLLKKEIGKIVRNFAFYGIVVCFLIFLIYGLTRGDWLNGVLAGLSLSMSLLPEEFPVMLTIFLTLGAWRMSKKNVLTRKNQAIETLGATSTLCVDKTGTLTLNKMSLTGIGVGSTFYEVNSKNEEPFSETYLEILEYAVLSSQKNPFDPLEREIKESGRKLLGGGKYSHRGWELIKEYPLTGDLMALSQVWQLPAKKTYVIAAKGAPEAVIDLCHLPKARKEEILESVKIMSTRGLRIIGVAKAIFESKDLPTLQHDFHFEYLGLLGFSDPIRPEVVSALQECYTAGIRVIIVTGDYPGTASFIAQKIGLKNPDVYITGDELAKLSRRQLREKIQKVNIFARVVPAQKLAIIDALKANGEVVAMTGDGVNDAPALKAAHIGIAMGERGTDVARETADLVLLDDNFTSIVSAVRLGRRIFDNLQKAVSYIFSVHVPIVGMTFIPILFQLPVVLFPSHIAFLELIIDPASTITFEAEEEEGNIMARSPRNLKRSLFSPKQFLVSMFQGVSVLAIVLTVYLLTLEKGFGGERARTMAFVTMVLGNLMLIITNLSKAENVIKMFKRGNKSLNYILIGTLIFLALILYVPALRDLFHFSILSSEEFLLGVGMAFLTLIWFEVIKAVKRGGRVSA